MKTIKNSIAYSAALLMAASVGSVYAEDADMTQTRSQDRVREELNLQVPESAQAQNRLREQGMEQNMGQMGQMGQMKNQIRNEYRHRQNTQTRPTQMNRSSRGAR